MSSKQPEVVNEIHSPRNVQEENALPGPNAAARDDLSKVQIAKIVTAGLKNSVPGVLVVVTEAAQQFVTFNSAENECSANNQYLANVILFTVLLFLGVMATQTKVGFKRPFSYVFYGICQITTIGVWLLCTNPDYLVCFRTNGKNSMDYEAFKTLKIISGLTMGLWAIVIAIIEGRLDTAKKNLQKMYVGVVVCNYLGGQTLVQLQEDVEARETAGQTTQIGRSSSVTSKRSAGIPFIELVKAAVGELKTSVPGIMIVISQVIQQYVTFDSNENECSANGEYLANVIVFVLLVSIGTLCLDTKVGFNSTLSAATYTCLKITTLGLWLLCTNSAYLVCFRTGGKNPMDHEALKIMKIVSGAVMGGWAVLIAIVEGYFVKIVKNLKVERLLDICLEIDDP
jgi:protein-S-isoprenylcysteine O-methyltransferase Ste14